METTTNSTIPISSGLDVSANIKISYKKNVVLVLILLIFFISATCFILLHAYIAWELARPVIAPLASNPQSAIGSPYENVRFLSANGQNHLDGWYIPAATSSSQTVIFSHGYGSNREESWVPMYDLAKAAHSQSYNVLMFDYGFVKPYQIVTGGVQETQELLGAIRLAKEKGARKIYIWGFSMGAGTALQAALVSNDITAMILDSTFILNPDTLYQNLRQHIDLPRFPSLPLIRLFLPLLNGTALKNIPYPTVASHTYNIPIYFIHGKKDRKAPYGLVQSIFANQKSNEKSALWLLPKDHHELIYRAHPQEYLRRVFGFLQTAPHFNF